MLSPTADGPGLATAATAARWPLPTFAVVVITPPDPITARAIRWAPDTLIGQYREASVAVLSAPVTAEDQRALLRAVTGHGAVISPARPPARLHTVLDATRLAHELLADRVLTAEPLLVDEHLATLILHRDKVLSEALIRRRLSPLDNVKDSTRTRLAETLLSWLRHRGEWQHIAAELHIHPQTVGYRLAELRALFGPDLDDPTARFELQMALHADPSCAQLTPRPRDR